MNFDDPSEFPKYAGLNKMDDEGQRVRKIELVNNGELSGYLFDLDSSEKMGNISFLGCARRQSYLFKPQPRMRATFITPAPVGVDISQMVANTKKGILIDHIFLGQANPINGTFYLQGKGYYIINGRVRNPVFNIILTGEIISTLKNIEQIGTDFCIFPVQCGKAGQFIPVCVGSPSMKVNSMKVIGGQYGS